MSDPTEAKIEMITFKEQLRRNSARLYEKQMKRRIKAGIKPQQGMIVTGNKDTGVPYHGKDRFSGQNRKFADRIIWDYEMEDGRVVNRLFVLDNSKYNGDGSLKD